MTNDSAPASGAAPNTADGPLTGIKVIDFSSFIAGPFGAMLLGDMGAEVIKVEALGGDGARMWGPFLAGESRLFQGWNRNKRSVAINLRSEAGREVIHKLAAEADIVIENFRPGVTERLSIDYATLSAINPRLIYCSSTAFGSRGPYKKRPGYDPLLQSMGGAAAGNVRFSGKVAICSVAVSDYQAAMLVATSVNAALFHRERTGEGQLVETSLLQAVMSVQSHNYVQALECEEDGPLGIFPYRLFDTKDTQIFIAAPTNKFWGILCEAMGVPELGAVPRYDSNPKRVTNADELAATMQAILDQETTAHWEELFVTRGLPCASVHTYAEFFDDPQVEAMDMRPVIDHPAIGPTRMAGLATHFGKTPGSLRRAAPTLGQHNAEVLGELGYEAARIAELTEQGVLGN